VTTASQVPGGSVAEHVREPFFTRFIRELAPQDWLVVGYVTFLNVAALYATQGSARIAALERVFPLFVWVVAALLLVRSGWFRHPFGAPLLYRVSIYGSVQISYFLFLHYLPLVNPSTLDPQLHQIDLALFGFEPALVMDRWVNPITAEWFAFFYFSYFFVLAIHVITILFFARHERMHSEFCNGFACLFCIGHTVYVLVPGWGPYRTMAHEFHNALPPGHWVDLVMSTVASGGAQKDIFPSIHTAAPTFLALFSFRHRKLIPFKYSWMIVAPISINIIIATMFLRWHYVIDVVAGLLLAFAAFEFAVWSTRVELPRRAALGLTRSWPEFFPEKSAKLPANSPEESPNLARPSMF
jgi:hypothetical protein